MNGVGSRRAVSLKTDLLNLATGARAAVNNVVNETTIRLAVTGLGRSGKTVFITSLINNLLAMGQQQDTLPKLRACLEADRGSRLRDIRVAPAGTATTPFFDYEAKFADLAAELPHWPPRTEDIAQVGIEIEIARGPMLAMLGTKRIRLEILDYPGEWLLDLPLLSQSYEGWSAGTIKLLEQKPRDAASAEFRAFLHGFDPTRRADEALLLRGHRLYRQALDDCRSRYGLRYLQPGRFMVPGPRSDAPFMWFFPAPVAPEMRLRGSSADLLRDRFETYKSDMRARFFDTHFTDFDRQIVLVDVLAALRAGRVAFEDTARAIGDIARSMSYAGGMPRAMQQLGSAALRMGGQILPNFGYKALRVDAVSRALTARRIDRVAFVATKADHVPSMRRENLKNLVRALVESARGGDVPRDQKVSYHTIASVLSTTDSTVLKNGHPIEVVLGVLLGEDRRRPFYPGEVPSGPPPEHFWDQPYFELPIFTPPRLDPAGTAGIPHRGLDEVLKTLLEDKLR